MTFSFIAMMDLADAVTEVDTYFSLLLYSLSLCSKVSSSTVPNRELESLCGPRSV